MANQEKDLRNSKPLSKLILVKPLLRNPGWKSMFLLMLNGGSNKILVKNARKFRESAPNQILIFGEPPPRVGVSENVWGFKFKCADRANMRYI